MRKTLTNLLTTAALAFSTLNPIISNQASALTPYFEVPTNHVDKIEINHLYDEKGKIVFDQIIYYDWKDSPFIEKFHCPKQNKLIVSKINTERYEVRAWRLLKDKSQWPSFNWETKRYESIWHDEDVLRKVSSKTREETWTQYDPELVEREYLPKEKRLELRKLHFEESINLHKYEPYFESTPPNLNNIKKDNPPPLPPKPLPNQCCGK